MTAKQAGWVRVEIVGGVLPLRMGQSITIRVAPDPARTEPAGEEILDSTRDGRVTHISIEALPAHVESVNDDSDWGNCDKCRWANRPFGGLTACDLCVSQCKVFWEPQIGGKPERDLRASELAMMDALSDLSGDGFLYSHVLADHLHIADRNARRVLFELARQKIAVRRLVCGHAYWKLAAFVSESEVVRAERGVGQAQVDAFLALVGMRKRGIERLEEYGIRCEYPGKMQRKRFYKALRCLVARGVVRQVSVGSKRAWELVP